MQMSHIPTCVVRAQDVDVIPTRENSVHTNKDLCCHRELSAWCLIHNPALIEERAPAHLYVLHCATSPIFGHAREPFLLVQSVLWLTKQCLICMGIITKTVKGWKPLCWCQTPMASNFRVVARIVIISVISKEFKVVVKKKVPHHPGK